MDLLFLSTHASTPPDILAAKEGSESDCTLVTARSRSSSASSMTSNVRRFWADDSSNQGRSTESLLDDSSKLAAQTSQQEVKRPRGRPPTIGQYVGLAAEKETLNQAEEEALLLEAEKDVADHERVAKQPRESYLKKPSVSEDPNKSSVDLTNSVVAQVAIIKDVALRSKNLKGTFVRALKVAAATITEAVVTLSGRTVSEETRQLQAANSRLQGEMASLRAELAELKKCMERANQRESPVCQFPPSGQIEDADMPDIPMDRLSITEERSLPRNSQPAPDPNPATISEEFMRAVSLQVGAIVSARLDGLEAEGRLLPPKQLRPDLGAARKKQVVTPSASVETKKTVGKKVIDTTKKPQSAPAPGAAKKTAAKKKEGTGTQPAKESPTSRPLPPPPTSMGEGWNRVAGRGKKAKTAPDVNKPKPKPTEKAKAQKLKAPRSAAVVLTLQPEAVERGVTYKDVIAEARTKIHLTDLDIPGGLRFKRAATGACILEVPGASSGDKANKLAEAIMQQISQEKIRVSRPTKCVDIRVTGLDDSVSAEEVAAAVAHTGDCPIDTVKVGEIRRGLSGLGTVWAQCPIMAAKKIVARGRLLVGWISAQVKLLDQRPQRCFRCLRNGHVRAQCQMEVDRTQSCFNCGKDGHKAAQCTAPSHCVECAAAGKPAEHRLSSKACNAPRISGKRMTTKAADGPRVPSQPVQSPAMEEAATKEGESMVVV